MNHSRTPVCVCIQNEEGLSRRKLRPLKWIRRAVDVGACSGLSTILFGPSGAAAGALFRVLMYLDNDLCMHMLVVSITVSHVASETEVQSGLMRS